MISTEIPIVISDAIAAVIQVERSEASLLHSDLKTLKKVCLACTRRREARCWAGTCPCGACSTWPCWAGTCPCGACSTWPCWAGVWWPCEACSTWPCWAGACAACTWAVCPAAGTGAPCTGAAGAVVGICWAGTPWAGTRPWLALWLVAVMIVSPCFQRCGAG